jgi:hypothetical protein
VYLFCLVAFLFFCFLFLLRGKKRRSNNRIP